MDYNEKQIDALRELINIGMGNTSGTLNELLDSHIKLNVPSLTVLSPSSPETEKIIKDLPHKKIIMTSLDFINSFSGKASLTFSPESADNLVALLTGESAEDKNFTKTRRETLTEVGNIVLNSIMGTISNILKENLEYRIPEYSETKGSALISSDFISSGHDILMAITSFQAEKHDIKGDIIIIFEPGAIKVLLEAIKNSSKTDI